VQEEDLRAMACSTGRASDDVRRGVPRRRLFYGDRWWVRDLLVYRDHT
jgi:hypothetical protein